MSAPSGTTIGAGAAMVELPTPVGVELGGYGARVGTSTGRLDPLMARAVVVAQDEQRVGIVGVDLLFATHDIVSGVRRLAHERLGLASDHLVLVATHTHSGPAALNSAISGNVVAAVVDAILAALEAAAAAVEPVRIKAGMAPLAGIGANRRGVDRPVDTHVRMIVFERAANGEPVAVLFSHACHATVLEADNLLVSADFPGAACRVVEDATGAVAVFLQGCAGDVNPVWLAHTASEVDRLGRILGHTVLAAINQVAAAGRSQRVVELRLLRDIEVAAACGTLIENPDVVATSTTVSLQPVARRTPDSFRAELSALEADFARAVTTAAADAVAPALAELRMHEHFAEGGIGASSLDVAVGSPSIDIEVGVIRFDDAHGIVWLPGEPLSAAAEQIRGALDLPGLLVAGYANGAIGYLPTCDEFDRRGYEVGSTVFPPGACETLVEACVAAARAGGLGVTLPT